ncbi:UDP-N-acetylmuramoyl-L-alanine--D-glutamate ligase [Caloramator sp. E03]|uniref:UDP-N-acetylmuramoyl-L-alanine--D-glutamate ligase n=1 Tax=Caloramator sp. E03 TaxID=2576307 RepID=UPI00269EDF09
MNYNIKEFKESVKGKKVAVVGIGVSNAPLIEMLLNYGAEVIACDKKEDFGELEEKFKNKNVKFFLGKDYLKGVLNSDIIFRTPSLRPDNEYLKIAKEKGAYVTSEIREFLKYCPAKIFGVTGSDGKTTTTTLIYEMLKEEGYRVFLGGNIGNPLLNRIEEIDMEDYVVVELSSFQLMDVDYSPNVSVITNLSPNHLDIHKGMDEYINSKKNIFLYQKLNDIVILNEDNEITNSMKGEIRSNIRTFSMKDSNAFSYFDGQNLICNNNVICNVKDVKLIGMHNIENLLAAFSAVYGFVSLDSMRKVATNFTGVEHRIEFVREIDGIKFYNDSIASSPTRTVAGLKSFNKKVILIAGGYDKKIPFDELAVEGIDKIKTLILMGATKEKIEKAFEDEMEKRNINIPILKVDTLEEAVKKAYNLAQSGDIITLSPACASFDMFRNFEERGKKFKEIVMRL